MMAMVSGPWLLLLLLLHVPTSDGRNRANDWGSLDGAGAYTLQGRSRDALDEHGGVFESLARRDRKTDSRTGRQTNRQIYI